MPDPIQNPDEFLDETNEALKNDGTSMPLSSARANIKEWIDLLAGETTAGAQELRTGLQQMLPLLDGIHVITNAEIKPIFKSLALQVKAIADAMPDDEPTPPPPPGGPVGRPRKRRMSDLAWTLVIMAI